MCCATRAATSWPTMGGTPARSNTISATSRLLRRFATRRSHRIGLRISGEIEKNAPPDASDQIKDPHPPPRIKGAHLRDSSDITDMYEVKRLWLPLLPHAPVKDELWPARELTAASERFTVGPRTSQSLHARLRVQETRRTGWGQTHVSHETSRVHHVVRRRCCSVVAVLTAFKISRMLIVRPAGRAPKKITGFDKAITADLRLYFFRRPPALGRAIRCYQGDAWARTNSRRCLRRETVHSGISARHGIGVQTRQTTPLPER